MDNRYFKAGIRKVTLNPVRSDEIRRVQGGLAVTWMALESIRLS